MFYASPWKTLPCLRLRLLTAKPQRTPFHLLLPLRMLLPTAKEMLVIEAVVEAVARREGEVVEESMEEEVEAVVKPEKGHGGEVGAVEAVEAIEVVEVAEAKPELLI